MPSTSKSQQRLFCMALAVRKGELARSKVNKAVLDIVDGDMTNKQIEDFTVLKESQYFYKKDTKKMKDLKEHIEQDLGQINEASLSCDGKVRKFPNHTKTEVLPIELNGAKNVYVCVDHNSSSIDIISTNDIANWLESEFGPYENEVVSRIGSLAPGDTYTEKYSDVSWYRVQ